MKITGFVKMKKETNESSTFAVKKENKSTFRVAKAKMVMFKHVCNMI